MSLRRYKLCLTTLMWLIVVSAFLFLDNAQALSSVVISEVQVQDSEFVELYNLTDQDVDLSNYYWTYYSSGKIWSEPYRFKKFPDQAKINAKGFYLIGLGGFATSTADWLPYDSSQLGNSAGSIGIFNLDPRGKTEVEILAGKIDVLSWGDVSSVKEGTSAMAPSAGYSLERKASGYSTATSLGSGGAEVNSGNGYDTDNNLSDFVLQNLFYPQNTAIAPESDPPLSAPPPEGPICGNHSCEASESINNCPADCSTNSGESQMFVPYQVRVGDVIINEIFSEPDSLKNEEEWLELYNITNFAIDLTGWTIEDNTHKPNILQNIILAPHQYFVLTKEDFNFTLNNSGDIIILKSGETIIDQATYGDFEDGNLSDNATCPNKSLSIGRTNNHSDTNNDKNDFWLSEAVTPGQINKVIITGTEQTSSEENILLKLTTATSGSIFISEVLPNPKGDDSQEWLELYNNSDQVINLESWKLDDGEGGSRPYIFPKTEIGPKAYLLLSYQITKLVFNNDFDTVRLFDPLNRIHYQVDYKNPPEGASYARNFDGSFSYTKALTPGGINIFPLDIVDSQVDQIEDSDESESNDLDLSGTMTALDELVNFLPDEKIIIKGVVVAQPDIFAKTYFYLDGAQIYSYQGNFPELKIGDEIEVRGTLSSAFHQRRIKINSSKDIVLLSHQNITPRFIQIGELGEQDLGSFIQVAGQLIEKQGNKFYLDDGNEIEVYLSTHEKIDKKSYSEGQYLIVSGILTIGGDNWRLLPRGPQDLIVDESIQGVVENSDSILVPKEIQNQNLEALASSAGGVWSKVFVRPELKYSLAAGGVLVLFLLGCLLKLKGII